VPEYWLNPGVKDWGPEPDITDCLVRLDICERSAPHDLQEKVIIWTEKYDKLYQYWPELPEEKRN